MPRVSALRAEAISAAASSAARLRREPSNKINTRPAVMSGLSVVAVVAIAIASVAVLLAVVFLLANFGKLRQPIRHQPVERVLRVNAISIGRSEERRVGKECRSWCVQSC